jgi:hypothetical protein
VERIKAEAELSSDVQRAREKREKGQYASRGREGDLDNGEETKRNKKEEEIHYPASWQLSKASRARVEIHY